MRSLLISYLENYDLVERVNRQLFELCVSQMMWDLKSGDAAIEASREYADYREQ